VKGGTSRGGEGGGGGGSLPVPIQSACKRHYWHVRDMKSQPLFLFQNLDCQ